MGQAAARPAVPAAVAVAVPVGAPPLSKSVVEAAPAVVVAAAAAPEAAVVPEVQRGQIAPRCLYLRRGRDRKSRPLPDTVRPSP
jgi:hypothetical protein